MSDKPKSSNIESITYKDGTLAITFKGGTTYLYEGVSEKEHNEFNSAESWGGHFYKNIRSKYEGKKQKKEGEQ